MSTSLRDQLVQAGLASKNDARNAAKQQRKQARQKGRGEDQRQREARRAQEAKVARDRALDLERKAEAEKKAKRAEIQQLLEHNRLPPANGDDYFNFADGGKVRRLSVTAETRERIIRGDLLIVRDGTSFAVVPVDVGERIRERDAEAIVTLESSAASDLEGYEDYVVPDDLVW